MSADADRNLLFGIFAVQMDMLTREELLAGMNAWATRQEVPLCQVLMEQGVLLAYDIDLINQLVDRKVERQGGDVTLCLQSATEVTTGVAGSQAINNLQTMTHDGLHETNGLHETLSRMANYFRSGTAADASSKPSDASQPRSSRSSNLSTGYAAKPISAGVGSQAGVRFQDVMFHAEGGLGEVWKAHDEELGREVALKRIKQKFSSSQESRVRFVWEAEITGNLEHPGIVPVYGFGRYADGRPYYAMRFIRGESLKHEIEQFLPKGSPLSQFLTPQNLAFRKLLTSFISTCHTIHFAHCAGVIHRDIKPANIMIGSFGETLVVDWGLAKKLDAAEQITAHELPTVRRRLQSKSMGESTETQMGSAMGTPAYMSPEQAAGKWNEVGSAADIYSLGATLYHLITGDVPIQTKNLTELLTRVEKGDFPQPRAANPQVPKGLDAICMKAMARLPADRYATARDLADDLECWLADREVSAYPETRLEKVSRWVRHNTSKVYAIAGSSLVLVVAIIAVAISSRNAAVASRQALNNFNERRKAVDDWSVNASELLKYYPGVQPAREQMLQAASEQYEQLSQEQADDDTLKLELATIRLRLGDVQRLQGKSEAAEQSYAAAEAAFATLRTQSASAEADRQWTQTRVRQALMLWDANQAPEALEALAATRSAVAGDSLADQESKAYCLVNEGSILLSSRELADARLKLDDAVKLAMAVVDATRRGDSLREHTLFNQRVQLLANAKALQGHCLAQLGEMRAGRAQLEEALRHFESLVEFDSRHPGFLEELAATRIALCDTLRRQADYPAALDQYRHAISDYERLNKALPDVPLLREKLANARVNQAQLLLELGQIKAAQKELDIAAPIMQEVEAKRNGFADFRLNFAALVDAIGEVYREGDSDPDHLAAATRSYLNAEELAADALPTHPQEAGERRAITRSHRAQLLERRGQTEEAEQLYLEAIEGLRSVAANSFTARHAQAIVQVQLGDLFQHTDRGEKAAPQYTQAKELWTSLAAEPEPSPEFLNSFAWLLANCRDAAQRDLQLAERHIDRALKLAPPNPNFVCTQAAIYYRQGLYEQSASLLDTLRKSPDGGGGSAGRVLVLLAMNRWQLASHDDARKLLQTGLEWQQANRPGNRELSQLVAEAEQLITGE